MTSCRSTTSGELRRNSRLGAGEEIWPWIKGAAISLTIFGLFMVLAARSISSRPAVNELCLKQMAREEHTTLEAFFQNPADQDALVQAITACSQ
jgi:hypothetical protein